LQRQEGAVNQKAAKAKKKVEANSKRGGGSQGGQEKGGRKRRKVGDEDEQTATSPSLQGGGKGKGKQAGNGKQLQRQVALEISGQGEGGVLEGGSDGDRTTFSHSGNTSDNLDALPPAQLQQPHPRVKFRNQNAFASNCRQMGWSDQVWVLNQTNVGRL